MIKAKYFAALLMQYNFAQAQMSEFKVKNELYAKAFRK
tara:strand:- start:386 stop:499 length:114 start_codon:yes stop_codon:yes gene_type:complete